MWDIIKTMVETTAFVIKGLVVILGIYVAFDKASKVPAVKIETDREYNRKIAAKQRAEKVRLR